ncbi:MAG: hypothetical protein PHX82_14310, partial [Paracoccaceae bacterium]|nr:hypothetical protein [Paracoccaceae bacterium]
MTIDVFVQTDPFVVAGVGPYQISSPYIEGAIRVHAVIDGVPMQLTEGDDFTVTPASSASTGDVVLSAAAAATHAGRDLWIDRDTVAMQSWEARYGDREVGMEAQLDRLTMAVQELREQLRATIRGRAALAAYDPEPNRVPIIRADGLGLENGPSAEQIAGAAQKASDAASAASNAATSALA